MGLSKDDLLISIATDSHHATEGLKDIEKALKKLGSTGNLMAEGLKETGGKLDGIFKLGTIGVGIEAAKIAFEALHKMAEAAKEFFEEPIKAAMESEVVAARLKTSLELSGAGGEEAAKGIEGFAFAMSKSTGINDEAIKKIIATNVAIGMTVPQAKEAAEAAAGLAKFQGVDLVQANESLVESLNGMTRGLGRVLPDVKSLTADQVRHGAAIKLVREQLSGFVSSEANTTQGMLSKLSTSWDRLVRGFGDALLKGAGLPKLFGSAEGAIGMLSGAIDKNQAIIGRFAANVVAAATMIVNAFTKIATVVGPVLKLIEAGFNSIMNSRFVRGPDWERMMNVDGMQNAIKKMAKALQELPTKENLVINEKLKGINFGTLAPKKEDTGPINLKMTDEQKQKLLEMQKTINEQRLTAERAYDNELVAAYQIALEKIKDMQRQAAHDGINIDKDIAGLKSALRKKLAADQQREYLADRAAAAQASGDALAMAETAYRRDVQAHADAVKKKHMTEEEQGKANQQSLLQRDLAVEAAYKRAAALAGDLTMIAERQYREDVANLKQALDQKLISQEQYAKGVEKANEHKEAAQTQAPFQEATQKMSDTFAAGTTGMVTGAMGVVGAAMGIADSALGAAQKMVDFLPNFFDKIAHFVDSLTDFPTKLTNAAGHIADSLLRMVRNAIPNLVRSIGTAMTKIMNFVEQLPKAFEQMFAKLPSMVGQIVNRIPQFIQRVLTALLSSGPRIIAAFIRMIIQMLPILFKAIVQQFPVIAQAIVRAIVDGFVQAWHAVLSLFKGGGFQIQMPDMGDAMKKLGDGVQKQSSKLFAVVDASAASAGNNAAKAMADAIEGATNRAALSLKMLWKALSDLWHWVLDHVITPIVTVVQKAWQWVLDKVITPIADVVQKAWKWVDDHIIKPLTSIGMASYQWVEDHVVKPLGHVGQEVWGWVESHVVTPLTKVGSEVWGWVKDKIVDPLTNIGQKAWQWVKDNIVDKLGQPMQWLKDFGDRIDKLFGEPGWLKPFKDAIDKLSSAGPGGGGGKNGGELGKVTGGVLATGGGLVYAAGGAWMPRGNDQIPAMYEQGEFVVRRRAVNAVGVGVLQAINQSGQIPGAGHQTIHIEKISIENHGEKVDESTIRNKLMPEVFKQLKKASTEGRFVMSPRGMRNV